jgi:hypothetical protein
MRLLLICLLMLNAMLCIAQSNNDIHQIKGKCFDGYIFPKTYTGFFPIENIKGRFTPQQLDVLKAEKTLKEQLNSLNKDLLNQTGNCPDIHKNLKKYKRQYIGVIAENGDCIIWINFIWIKDKESIKKINDEIIIILDGCSYYWNVKVNLTKGKLFDLSINAQS